MALLLVLLVGGTGLLALTVKSFIAAGLVGVLALTVLVALLLDPRRAAY